MSTKRGYSAKISSTVGELAVIHSLRLLYVFSMPSLMVLMFSWHALILFIMLFHSPTVFPTGNALVKVVIVWGKQLSTVKVAGVCCLGSHLIYKALGETLTYQLLPFYRHLHCNWWSRVSCCRPTTVALKPMLIIMKIAPEIPKPHLNESTMWYWVIKMLLNPRKKTAKTKQFLEII